jgi:hypothetical protein
MNIRVSKAENKLCWNDLDRQCRTTNCMAWVSLVRIDKSDSLAPSKSNSPDPFKYTVDPDYGRCGMIPLTCKHE